MSRSARVAALCRFSTVSNLRSAPARIGAAVFLAVAFLGQVLARSRGGAAPDDDRLFGYAFLVGAVFLLRSGLAEQRRRGTDVFLRHNFLSPGEQIAGHAAALVLLLALYSVFCLGSAALFSGGDLRFAAWYTAVLGLGTALFLPAVLLVELLSDLRLPFVLVPVGLLLTMAVAEPIIGAGRLLAIMGLRFARYDPATLIPILVRTAVVLPLVFGLIIALYAHSHRPGT